MDGKMDGYNIARNHLAQKSVDKFRSYGATTDTD